MHLIVSRHLAGEGAGSVRQARGHEPDRRPSRGRPVTPRRMLARVRAETASSPSAGSRPPSPGGPTGSPDSTSWRSVMASATETVSDGSPSSFASSPACLMAAIRPSIDIGFSPPTTSQRRAISAWAISSATRSRGSVTASSPSAISASTDARSGVSWKAPARRPTSPPARRARLARRSRSAGVATRDLERRGEGGERRLPVESGVVISPELLQGVEPLALRGRERRVPRSCSSTARSSGEPSARRRARPRAAPQTPAGESPRGRSGHRARQDRRPPRRPRSSSGGRSARRTHRSGRSASRSIQAPRLRMRPGAPAPSAGWRRRRPGRARA